MPPVTMESLLQAVAAYGRAIGRTPVDVLIHFADTLSPVSHTIPPSALAPEEAPAAAPPGLSEMERDVLEAVGPNTLTGEAIARLAGYEADASLRSCLAGLRRRGYLTGARGDAGYALTPLGRSVAGVS